MSSEAIGRATRSIEGEVEVWTLASGDERIARRWLTLGTRHAGGFVEMTETEGGLRLVRARGATLAERWKTKRGAWAWKEALAIAIDLADALAACEAASLFPGPLSPESVRIGTTTYLAADALLRAMIGERARANEKIDPRFIPSPQLDGAPWDAEANRCALGLILYRLLAGEHPFAGAGLRHALDAARHHEAPPFDEAIAKTLPSGLQGLTLRLLDPDPEARPSNAAAVLEDLLAVRGSGAAVVPRAQRLSPASNGGGPTGPAPLPGAERRRSREASASPEHRAPVVPRAPRHFTLGRAAPIAAGVAIAVAALAMLGPAPEAKTSATSGLPSPVASPLVASQTTAQTCAECHPRQASEWRRSVMAHAVKSPLFNALESLIEEQVGRDQDCPNGAGILRKARSGDVCTARRTGVTITGSGGEHWCVNCHSPAENLASTMPSWSARGDQRARFPVKDLLGDRALEGISCGFCHEVHGPVNGRGGYQGNASWISLQSGATFQARPEDNRGLFGIGNSGYDLRPEEFLVSNRSGDSFTGGAIGVHARPSSAAKSYEKTSEFCGACHDVRLFGTDTLGASKGEHFKRLRNAYSEWSAWAKDERSKGRTPATCQGCHMSDFPGTCEAGEPTSPECPSGSHFVAKAPGTYAKGLVATTSANESDVVTHWFSGVDLPLSPEYDEALLDEPTIDSHGLPLSAKKRRDLLLRHTFKFEMGGAHKSGDRLEIPLVVENVGAGHRVPAGFSQEREFWVHLVVKDANKRVVYEVGNVSRGDEDLHDKIFDRVTVRPDSVDGFARPVGVFGADVRDGPDVQQWFALPGGSPPDPEGDSSSPRAPRSSPPQLGGTSFRGKGLINFQNGFLRCVRCIGTIDGDGKCQPLPGQEGHRADRFDDGFYDEDTGECRSNLSGMNALFETYYPVGALDATRGFVKGPDAIVDTRSAPPNVPLHYTYDLPTNGARGPLTIEATLLFRAFPPFLIKAFAEYEREMARRGARPSGPLVTLDMLKRLEVVELARETAEVR